MKPEMNAFDTLLSRLDNDNRLTVISFYDMKELLANLSVGAGELNSFYDPKDLLLSNVKKSAMDGDFGRATDILEDWFDRFIWRLEWHGRLSHDIYELLKNIVEWSGNPVLDNHMVKVISRIASIISGEDYFPDYTSVARALLWMNNVRTADRARVRLVMDTEVRREFLDIVRGAYLAGPETRKTIIYGWNRLINILSDGFGHKIGVSKKSNIHEALQHIAGYEKYRLVLPTDALYFMDFWNRFSDARAAKAKPEPQVFTV